jgi:putative transferase (TIGR04331 family)
MNILHLTPISKSESLNGLPLGPWCLDYSDCDLFKDVNYHWNDRSKLRRDYFYLKKLKEKFIILLKNDLNKIHKVNLDKRSWTIILDPFLSNLISTIFDRWEVIRNIKKEFYYYNYKFKNNIFDIRDEYNFAEFQQNDYWNQKIFQDIINFQNKKKLKIRKNISFKKEIYYIKKNNYFEKIILKLYFYISYIFIKFNKIVIIDSYFSKFFFFFLSINLKKIFFFNFRFLFKNITITFNKNYNIRKNLLKSYSTKNSFEKFLISKIRENLLPYHLEKFDYFFNKAKSFKFNSTVIFSSGLHFYSNIFKFWIVDRIRKYCKFYILEHGGSLPAVNALFNYEEEICDKLITFSEPFHKKHKQMPAQRFILDIKSHSKILGNICLLVPNRVHRYTFRAEFYPMTGNNYFLIDFLSKFYKNLETKIKKNTYLKIHPDDDDEFWKNKLVYKKFINNFISEKSFKKCLKKTRFSICFYPETTFSESIAYDIPTVLVYPKEIYERHKITLEIQNELKSVNILFHCPIEASRHVNNLWDNPHDWWNNQKTRKVVNLFKRKMLGLSNYKSSKNKWLTFFKKI